MISNINTGIYSIVLILIRIMKGDDTEYKVLYSQDMKIGEEGEMEEQTFLFFFYSLCL